MKKLPTLHILNGDASVPAFKLADLPGQLLVWREILASGPAVYNMPQEAFWQMRQRYITENFRTAEGSYQEKVLNELHQLEHASHFFEVVLWFDQDLVCQVNLLYLLHALYLKKPGVVSVCTPAHGSIGYKTIEEVQQLFEHRQMLEPSQLQQAAAVWQLYAGPDPLALQAYLISNKLYSKEITQALTLHLKRFPDEKTYVGEHQLLLLKILAGGTTALTEIQKLFWQHDPGYGFGDWQLQAILKELSPELVQLSDTEALVTESGKQVLNGKAKFTKELTYWLGGVQLHQQNPAWCRDAATGEIKICGAQASTS